MLGCTNLGCRRGGRAIFAHLGLTLLPGCLLVVQGANGSGKTSFIKILCGILKADTGTVEWDGEIPFPEDSLYISHQNAIKADLTVEENLEFWSSLSGTEMLIQAAAQYWGLADKMGIPVARLSAGWQRRVTLSRLLLSPRSLWLLDEPATHLDDEGVNLLNSLITSRCRQGGIVVMASHGDARFLNAHILRLEDFAA